MKAKLTKMLLAALNSRFLNSTPCKYEFVGNIDAFSRSHLLSEDLQQPGITVKQVLEEADKFKFCPLTAGVTVIDGGEYRPATVWDIHQLRTELTQIPHGGTTMEATTCTCLDGCSNCRKHTANCSSPKPCGCKCWCHYAKSPEPEEAKAELGEMGKK